MTLPQNNGKTYIIRLAKFYSAIYLKRFGCRPTLNFKMLGRILKPLFTKYGEVRTAAIILVHFEQTGAQIIEARFPIQWVARHADEYLLFLEREREVDTFDDEALLDAIKNRCKYLDIKYF